MFRTTPGIRPPPRPGPRGRDGWSDRAVPERSVRSVGMDERGVLRIANCSGFYGDRVSAAREMVEGGPIDFLTGDYLAELTMLILWKARQQNPSRGYAVTFLKQMENVLGEAIERGMKIVT